MNNTQKKKWHLSLKLAAKTNSHIKKGHLVIDNAGDIITSKFYLKDTFGSVKSLGYNENKNCFICYGDNDPEYDNGIMHSTLKEIKELFKCKFYKEIK